MTDTVEPHEDHHDDERDDAIGAAYADMRQAIATWAEISAPGTYIEGFVLVTHKRTPFLEAEGKTAVGVATAIDQSFVLTRGLLEIALDDARSNVER